MRYYFNVLVVVWLLLWLLMDVWLFWGVAK